LRACKIFPLDLKALSEIQYYTLKMIAVPSEVNVSGSEQGTGNGIIAINSKKRKLSCRVVHLYYEMNPAM
jgi:hypothetical protein